MFAVDVGSRTTTGETSYKENIAKSVVPVCGKVFVIVYRFFKDT
jgi:hypothetical protein